LRISRNHVSIDDTILEEHACLAVLLGCNNAQLVSEIINVIAGQSLSKSFQQIRETVSNFDKLSPPISAPVTPQPSKKATKRLASAMLQASCDDQDPCSEYSKVGCFDKACKLSHVFPPNSGGLTRLDPISGKPLSPVCKGYIKTGVCPKPGVCTSFHPPVRSTCERWLNKKCVNNNCNYVHGTVVPSAPPVRKLNPAGVPDSSLQKDNH